MFDAKEYDEWYEKHRDLYNAELNALRDVVKKYPSPKLEIGVGTGRFAAPLRIEYGIDIDESMLKFAEQRGIKVIKAPAEKLPFPDRYFYMVLVCTTLPFLQDARKAMAEAHRVLRDDGGIVIAFIPADSYFGRKYRKYADDGDIRFRDAHFYTIDEVEHLLENMFYIVWIRSTLIGNPPSLNTVEGYIPEASFVVVEGRKI